jgi:hypothetical protein
MQQMAGLVVLHQLAGLHRTGLGQGAADEVGEDVAGREQGEDCGADQQLHSQCKWSGSETHLAG